MAVSGGIEKQTVWTCWHYRAVPFSPAKPGENLREQVVSCLPNTEYQSKKPEWPLHGVMVCSAANQFCTLIPC